MATVREALSIINRNCDGAVSQDGIGFNGVDTGFAKTLLTKTSWTPKMELAAYKLLRKYSKQLLSQGVEYSTLELVEQDPKPAERQMDLHFNGHIFELKSSFSEKDFIKENFHGRWEPTSKIWTFDPTPKFMSKALEHKDKFTSMSEEARHTLNHLYLEARKANIVNPTKPQQLDEKDNAAGAAQDLSTVKSYIKSEYFPHQRKAFESLITHPYFALFPEQRVGKTYPTIGAIGYRAEVDGVRRVLIVCPKTVMYEWEEKLSEEADYPVGVYLLDDELDKRRETLKGIPLSSQAVQISLINFDTVKRLQDDLVKWNPEMVIVDEAHHIKNGRSQQTKATWAIGNKAKFRAILTGTPVPEGPLDIWAQYRFLAPDIFGKSYTRFRDRYVVMGGYMGREVIGIKTVPTIQDKPNKYYDPQIAEEYIRKVYSIATRITLSEVNDSPDPKVLIKYAELEPEARRIYEKMSREAVLEIEGGKLKAPIVITKLIRLQQICGGFIKPDEGEKYQQVSWAKLSVLEKILLGLKGKAVIFAKFTAEIDAIKKLAEKHGINHHILTGKTKNRGYIRSDFQKNPNTRLFISQIGTGGEGITLSAADTTIFYSTGVSLREYDQAMSRIKNLVKTSQLTYIHILIKNSYDEKIMSSLNRKQDISKMSVDKLRKIIFKEEGTMPLPKEVEKVLERQPKGSGERFDAEIKYLLDEIDKDLESYGKREQGPSKTLDEFLDEQRQKKEAGETKKVPKKKREKGEKPKKEVENKQADKTSDGIVTLQDLGNELNMEPKDMRKILRSKFTKPEGGRWEWGNDDPELSKIKNALKGL